MRKEIPISALVALVMTLFLLVLSWPAPHAIPVSMFVGGMTGFSTWLACHQLFSGLCGATYHMVRLPPHVDQETANKEPVDQKHTD